MAYQELVKNFGNVRAYMREFAVYGLRSRDEYTGKSGRTYDDSRRRIESWLGEHLISRRSAEGKTVSLAIDTRIPWEDPLFKAWKSASFTDGDITLHFHLLDLLHTPMTLKQLLDAMDRRMETFPQASLPDESTLRKKLREYEKLGLVRSETVGKGKCWSRVPDVPMDGWEDALAYFSEIVPCGVVGSYILDRQATGQRVFSFKHHYITHTLDSGILLHLFGCMREGREAILTVTGRPSGNKSGAIPGEDGAVVMRTVPLRIYISAQSGRQYCMAWHRSRKRMVACRMDGILSVESGDVAEDFAFLREKLNRVANHMWGVSCGSGNRMQLDTVSFTVEAAAEEEYIFGRLEREKRCGTVERIDKNHARFTAQVWDSNEMFPWIRSFLCRITEIHFSSETLEKRFLQDVEDMFGLYGLYGKKVGRFDTVS